MFRLLVVLTPLLLLPLSPNEDPPAVDALGDPLPPGASMRLGSARLRMGWDVIGLDMSRDGKTIVSSGRQDDLYVWDVATGKLREKWHFGGLCQYLQYSHDGTLLVASRLGGSVSILDAKTGVEKHRLSVSMQNHSRTRGILSPDNRTLLIVAPDHETLTIYEVPTQARLHHLTGLVTEGVPPPIFTSDGKRFVTTWTDGRLYLIDVRSGKSIRCLEPDVPGDRKTVNSFSPRLGGVTLSHDDKTLIYRNRGEPVVNCVNLADGTARQVLLGTVHHRHSIESELRLSPDGKFLYERHDRGATVWAMRSRRLLRELTLSDHDFHQGLCVSDNGRLVAMAVGSKIVVWDVNSGETLHQDVGHCGSINQLLFSRDGKRLFSFDSHSILHWDLTTGKWLHRNPHRYLLDLSEPHLQESADGKAIEFFGEEDEGTRYRYRWRYEQDKKSEEISRIRLETNFPCVHRQPSSDGRWLACIATDTYELFLFDLTTPDAPPRKLFTSSRLEVNPRLIFSPDSRTLFVGQSRGTLELFDVFDVFEPRKITPISKEVRFSASPPIDFSGDGRSFLLDASQFIRWIETLTGGERVRFPIPEQSRLSRIKLSEDGRVAVWAERYVGWVRAVDTWTGRELLQAQTDQGGTFGLAISRDNRLLAVGGANGTVMIYDLPPLDEIAANLGFSDEKAWEELASTQADLAHQSMLHLQAKPDVLVKLLGEKLRPANPVDPSVLARWIDDLDSDAFAVRDQAYRELAQAGEAARAALKQATNSPSLEIKRRSEELLSKLGNERMLTGNRLRAMRIIEILARLDSAKSRAALRTILKARLGSVVDAEARRALGERSTDGRS